MEWNVGLCIRGRKGKLTWNGSLIIWDWWGKWCYFDNLSSNSTDQWLHEELYLYEDTQYWASLPLFVLKSTLPRHHLVQYCIHLKCTTQCVHLWNHCPGKIDDIAITLQNSFFSLFCPSFSLHPWIHSTLSCLFVTGFLFCFVLHFLDSYINRTFVWCLTLNIMILTFIHFAMHVSSLFPFTFD